MQNEHPHKFFKPFNGIDAIGRWAVIASLCVAAYLAVIYRRFMMMFEFEGGGALIYYSIAIFGIMIFFACGLGLCLRIPLARYATMVVAPVYVIIGSLISAIHFFGRGSGEEATPVFITVIIVSYVIVACVTLYLKSPGVGREFNPRTSDEVRVGRPHIFFTIGMAIIGLGHLVAGIILAEENFEYIDNAFRRLFEFDSGWASDGLAFFGFFFALYLGFLIVFCGILLAYRVNFARILSIALCIAYFIFYIVLFCGLGFGLMDWFSIPFGLWFASISFVACYLPWSVFRYLRSEQGKKTFSR
ncbi:MAG: hypothetical protein ACYS8W_03760 [Planctomycetota bacterium]|jgi:hypothetical protein